MAHIYRTNNRYLYQAMENNHQNLFQNAYAALMGDNSVALNESSGEFQLDGRLKQILAGYVQRYSDQEQLIEVKGILIDFIRKIK